MIRYDQDSKTAANPETGNSVRFVMRDPYPKDGGGDICEFSGPQEKFEFRLQLERGWREVELLYPRDRNWSQERKIEHTNFLLNKVAELKKWTWIVQFDKPRLYDAPMAPQMAEDFVRLVLEVAKGTRSERAKTTRFFVEFLDAPWLGRENSRFYQLDDAGAITVS